MTFALISFAYLWRRLVEASGSNLRDSKSISRSVIWNVEKYFSLTNYTLLSVQRFLPHARQKSLLAKARNSLQNLSFWQMCFLFSFGWGVQISQKIAFHIIFLAVRLDLSLNCFVRKNKILKAKRSVTHELVWLHFLQESVLTQKVFISLKNDNKRQKPAQPLTFLKKTAKCFHYGCVFSKRILSISNELCK